MRTIVFGFVLLAATAAQAEDRFADRRKCIQENMVVFGDIAVVKRLCDPKNYVRNPNEYGWICIGEEIVREKGAGAKQKTDAICE